MKTDFAPLVSGLALAAVAVLPCTAQPVRGLAFPKPDAPARLIAGSCGTAVYPPAAEQAGHEGVVLLVLTISDQGAVTAATVARSSRSAILDSESRYIAAQCRFVPAIKGGKPIYSEMTREFTWRLETPPPAASAASSS